ncbi:hypothetical protein P692DRAFT_201789165 [Suillus brevipes Sb2]|nr:hypothetical protein P692DRAFT_201789165 [Suillus brevipes Sb2]
MNFSWSTPLRRNGQSDLPLIPNEIYLHIFESIAPPDQPLSEEYVQTFSALALVCRFFCSVANVNRTLASRKSKWARQILANTEPAKSLALYVKECTFERWGFWEYTKESMGVLFAFATLYSQAMARMSNIQKVFFSSSIVKTDHWHALAELKQLDVLEFHSCSFIDDPPDRELTVRSVILLGSFSSEPPFTLRPIASTSLRSFEADDAEAALKIVAFRQLAIDNLFLDYQCSDMEPLLRVFQHLPGLQNVSIWLTRRLLPAPGELPLKKLFTRLHSFTIKIIGYRVPQNYINLLISKLCDGPGTLPSLEELNIYLGRSSECTTKLDTIYDCLNGMIIPAFPNVRRINADAGSIRLEEGKWKKHYSNRS